jgi:hypothetical protein
MQPRPGRNTDAVWSSKKKATGGGKLVVDPRPGNKAPKINPVVDPRPPKNTKMLKKPTTKIQPIMPRSNGGLFGVGGKLVNKVYKTY